MVKFEFPKSLSLARLPTPIRRLNRISKELKIDIYIKRDDLTGTALSGNKVRKLEFSLKQATDIGCDTLITTGGIQSNHSRAVAVLARQFGMEVVLVLRGEEPNSVNGNFFLDKLLDAKVRFITPEEYRFKRDEIMDQEAQKLKKLGKAPYIIPEGASNAIGIFGYIKAAKEIKEQLTKDNLKIDYIIIPVGSTGTITGLVIGKKLFGLDAEILGVNVCDTPPYLIDRSMGIIKEWQEKYYDELNLSPGDIKIIGGYEGIGYALNTKEELNLIKYITRLEGIILDPVYTIKAFRGMCEEIKKGRFRKEDKILFVHTGGIFGLFAKTGEFEFE